MHARYTRFDRADANVEIPRVEVISLIGLIGLKVSASLLVRLSTCSPICSTKHTHTYTESSKF